MPAGATRVLKAKAIVATQSPVILFVMLALAAGLNSDILMLTVSVGIGRQENMLSGVSEAPFTLRQEI